LSSGLRRLRPPPAVKVLEAAGAIGGGRVRVLGESGGATLAVVRSSGRPLSYRVAVAVEGEGRVRVYSEDNGTVHRGYVGYPIVALLMLRGVLPRDEEVEAALAGVNWYELNSRLKRYSRVMDEVLSGLPPQVRGRAWRLVNEALKRLRSMEVVYDEGLARLFREG